MKIERDADDEADEEVEIDVEEKEEDQRTDENGSPAVHDHGPLGSTSSTQEGVFTKTTVGCF